MAEIPYVPFTKRNNLFLLKRKKSGIKRVTSSSLSLILAMRVERGLLKSVSGASKFIGVLDRVSMKLQSKN
eukprot:1137176-Pelagomonas_calceolata.AAC.2